MEYETHLQLDVRNKDKIDSFINQVKADNPNFDSNQFLEDLKWHIEKYIILQNETFEQEARIQEYLRFIPDKIKSIHCFLNTIAAVQSGLIGIYIQPTAVYKREIFIPSFAIVLEDNALLSNMAIGYGGAGPSAIESILSSLNIDDSMLDIIKDYSLKDKGVSSVSFFHHKDGTWNREIK